MLMPEGIEKAVVLSRFFIATCFSRSVVGVGRVALYFSSLASITRVNGAYSYSIMVAIDSFY